MGPHLDWAGDFATLAWGIGGECFYCGGDVVATRLSAEAEPIDEEWTSVASEPNSEMVSDLASTGDGCTAIAYGRQHADSNYGVSRSFVRLFGDC